jgi:hypothetical protein
MNTISSLCKAAACGVVLAVSASSADAATILLDLQGKAGFGLLAGNENSTVNGAFGSGGEVGAGISFDDVSLVLTINVAWGVANGFTNLTGAATMAHIHGPTTSGGTGSFTQNASVLFNLDSGVGWNSSASAGGINKTVNLNSAQAADLLAGKYYINVHTSTNGGGEIRGNIVIPEPATASFLALGVGMLALRRRKS